MRIVHVITKGDVGGAQTHVVELAASQLAVDEVTIVAGSGGPALELARERGVTVEVVPALGETWSGGSLRTAYRELRAELDAIRPDVVHGHSSHGGLIARAAARRLRIPSVYTAHGWPFQRGAPWRQRLSSYAGEFVGARLGDAVICLTQSEADDARLVVPSRRLHIVANGIADVTDHRRPAERSARIAAEGPALVMVARFSPPKRQGDLIAALAPVGDVPWTLTFIGDGPDRPNCEALAASTFPDGRVRFAGHRDDVPAVLATHDVALLWSGYEGMPMALLEGMRAGLCCIANDLPGVRSLFGATGPDSVGSVGPAGIVAAGGADLANVVRDLVSSPAEIDTMGALARRRYLDAFTADAMAAATRDVYESILDRSRH